MSIQEQDDMKATFWVRALNVCSSQTSQTVHDYEIEFSFAS